MAIKAVTANVAKKTAHSLATWEWTKRLLHWLIISAGTMSECAFLIASLWMSVNASVHPLVLLAMNEQTSRNVSELATAAYVALPELILGLSVVVTLSHIRMFLYNKANYTALAWAGLYGLPTIVFLVLSLVTLGCSVLSVDFRLPEPLVVIRALAGFMFAFTSLLYTQLGVPQETDRLQQKDDLIGALRAENEINLAVLRQEKDAFIARLRQEKDAIIEKFRDENARLNDLIKQQKDELENSKMLLSESKNAQLELIKAVNKSPESALQAYSEECQNWLKSGVKTVSVEEITRFTGHSKRKIEGAITKGLLQTAPRNQNLILVSSLVSWLENTPAPASKTEHDTVPMLHVVPR